MEPVLDEKQQAKVKALVALGFSYDVALIAVLMMDIKQELYDQLMWIAGRIDAIPSGPAI